jgi:hypothetical protein
MANSILRDLKEKQEVDELFASAEEAAEKNDN